MANTLTGLYQTIYAAMNVVSRELIGMIPAVSKDSQAEQVTLNQPIRSPVVPAPTVKDISPSNISSTGENMAVTFVDVEITKQRKVDFHMTAEEERGLMAGGTMPDITTQRFIQSFRQLGNEIETDLAAEYLEASAAYGTPGTVPFATGDDLTDLSNLNKLLDDNGAPRTGRSLIMNTAVMANLQGKQPSVFKVNEAGDPMGRRQGAIGMLLGFDLGVSHAFPVHDSAAVTTGAVNFSSGYGIGTQTLTVSGYSGEAMNKGDLITFAGDARKYVLSAASGAAATELTINEPGLRIAAGNSTVINHAAANYTPSLAFTRDAFHLVCRVPAVPSGGDDADDRMVVMDPHSGLVYEISVYRQYRQVTYEVAICWGVKTVNGRHAGMLIY